MDFDRNRNCRESGIRWRPRLYLPFPPFEIRTRVASTSSSIYSISIGCFSPLVQRSLWSWALPTLSQIPHRCSCSPPRSKSRLPQTKLGCLLTATRLLTTSPQIVHAGTISKTIISQLSKCPSDTYIVVRQPGVRAEDYEDRYAAPHLRKKIHGEDDRIRSSMSVTDVLGDVNTAPIITAIERNCGAALSKIDAASSSFSPKKPHIFYIANLHHSRLLRHRRRSKSSCH